MQSWEGLGVRLDSVCRMMPFMQSSIRQRASKCYSCMVFIFRQAFPWQNLERTWPKHWLSIGWPRSPTSSLSAEGTIWASTTSLRRILKVSRSLCSNSACRSWAFAATAHAGAQGLAACEALTAGVRRCLCPGEGRSRNQGHAGSRKGIVKNERVHREPLNLLCFLICLFFLAFFAPVCEEIPSKIRTAFPNKIRSKIRRKIRSKIRSKFRLALFLK